MFMDRIGLRCERNAALKNKKKKETKQNKKIPNEINLKQKKHHSLIYKWMGWACARGAWGFPGGGGVYDDGSVQQEDFWRWRGGKSRGRWEETGFSTCSLWSRAGRPCSGGLVRRCRAPPRPGGKAAPCPPRWRSARTRPSGWAADCRGRPARWGPQAHTQTCKRSAPLPPGERRRGLSHAGMCTEKHSQLFFLSGVQTWKFPVWVLQVDDNLNFYKVEKQRLGCHVVENLLSSRAL